jgi:hypothetical protein
MRLKEEWRAFVRAEAGTRFARLHERKQAGRRGWWGRLAWWGMGVALMLAGLVMLVTPGPGILTLALGAACIAQESLPVALRCDRAELRLRAAWARWRSRR